MSTSFRPSVRLTTLTENLPLHPTVLPALIAGIYLRFWFLGHEALWVDETITLYFVQAMSYPELLVELPTLQPHLPLFYVLLKAWTSVVGETPMAARALAATFSTGTIVGLYLVGRDLYDRETGGVAAFILAINPFYIHFGTFTRMYSLLACLTVFSMWGFIRVRQTGTRRTAAVYCVATTLLVWTHYFALLVPLAQIVVLLHDHWKAESRPVRGWQCLGAVTPAILLSGSVILAKLSGGVGVGSAREVTHIATAPTVVDIARGHVRLLELFTWTYQNYPDAVTILLNALAVAPAAVAVLLAIRGYRRRDRLPVAWYSLPVIALIAASYLIKPVWQPKYLGFAGLGLILLMAKGIHRPTPRQQMLLLGLLGVGLVLPLSMAVTTPQVQQFDAAADYVGEHADEDDVVLVAPVHGEKGPLHYYFSQLDGGATVVFLSETASRQVIRQHATDGDDVWVVAENNQRGWVRTVDAALGLPQRTQFHGIAVYRSDTP